MPTSVRTFPSYYSPIGKQILTVSSSPVGFTFPVSPQVRAAFVALEYITVQTDFVRFWVDGSVPTGLEGIILYSGDTVEFTNVDMINKFLTIAHGNDMQMMIEYFGGGV